MTSLFGCLTDSHGLRLVALAALTVFGGVYAALTLLRQAMAEPGGRRLRWLAAAAFSAGTGAWVANLILMLACQAGVPVRYVVWLALLSLSTAIGGSFLSLKLALARPDPVMRAVSGVLLGLAFATMHYTGMAALVLPGVFLWNERLLDMSLILAAVSGAASLVLMFGRPGRGQTLMAALILAAGICGMDFIAMRAAAIEPVTGAAARGAVMSPALFLASLAMICLLILSLGAAMAYRRRIARDRAAQLEASLRALADIAVEGLVVCDGGIVVTANDSFLQLAGYQEADIRGVPFARLFQAGHAPALGPQPQHIAGEAVVLSLGGDAIPVEIAGKPIVFAGRPHQVLALRDLRERQRADEAMRFLAHHDSLTGLANRAAFTARLSRHLADEARTPLSFAIFAIDIDRFKEVIDALGHDTGDLLLSRVAGRLRATVRDTDCVARLGGDEFAVLAPNPLSEDTAMALAERMVDVLGRPFILDGKIVNSSASVGIAFAPADGADSVTLLKNADLALHRAKAGGRNRARRFEPGMDLDLQRRRALELDLRRALVHEQLEMHYQPLFDLRTQQVCGFEALARWRHPQRGPISPAEFIPVAEETGLIVPLGEFVLHASTAEAAKWDGDMSVAINLSAAQFAGGRLVETVRSALKRSGIKPSRLELEITESVLLRDSDETLRVLHQLRDLGVRIAMDDFGTGYSSLRYLRSFPFDRIKIDRSFVQEMLDNDESAAIISAVVALSQKLGILTTAEGVETEAQMVRVREEGCDTAQGYLIGRPSPAADLWTFLRGRQEELA
jgi:diguanylate cyclase (GGDEF)-like protein/PAS domain S-box-containing protein